MKFSDITGQETIIEVLKRAIRDDRCSSAYLFAGPDGVGKKMTALAFARVLNCTGRGKGSADACGECVSCRKISANNHPDVRIIGVAEDKKEISIEQIRDLERDVSYKPLEALKKVYIIEDANALNMAAANCLLKTLEEPPLNVVLILIASNIHGILATIRSRCQIFRFRTIPARAIQKFLRERCDQQEDKAEAIARLACGRLGEAVKYASSGIESVMEQVRRAMDMMNNYEGSQDYEAMFDLCVEINRDRESVAGFLDCLAMCLRHDFVKSPRKETRDRISAVLRTRDMVSRNVNPELALNGMFLELCPGKGGSL